MLIRELTTVSDVAAARSSQHRTFTHYPRKIKKGDTTMSSAAILKRAQELRAKKNTASKSEPVKTEKTKKVTTKKSTIKKAAKKEVTPRVQIKDGKGKPVTGRDNSFHCKHCKTDITGPWSYKMHLVNQHDYSREEAGLRPERKK